LSRPAKPPTILTAVQESHRGAFRLPPLGRVLTSAGGITGIAIGYGVRKTNMGLSFSLAL
jgi:hypothetical protein